jgi:hypothetical protein
MTMRRYLARDGYTRLTNLSGRTDDAYEAKHPPCDPEIIELADDAVRGHVVHDQLQFRELRTLDSLRPSWRGRERPSNWEATQRRLGPAQLTSTQAHTYTSTNDLLLIERSRSAWV